MKKNLYKYKGSIVALSSNEIEDLFNEIEKDIRKNNIKYSESLFSKDQLNLIKNSWSNEFKSFLREKLKDKKEKPSLKEIGKEIFSILSEEARSRAKKRSTDRTLPNILKYELKLFSADMALSSLFKKAPSITPTNIKNIGNLSVYVQVSDKPVRLVVDSDKVKEAKVYILGIFNEDTLKTRFLGWIGQTELENAKTGDKSTDPKNCSWSKMSNYIEYKDLKPMSELISRLKIEEVSDGLIFENVPEEKKFPVLSRLRPIDTDAPDPGDDYGSFFEDVETNSKEENCTVSNTKEDEDFKLDF